MTVETKETDLEQDTNPLHILQQAIANMPAIDQEKVQAVLNKIKSGTIEILGSEEERIECAKRIAKQIMDETTQSDE